MDPSKLLLPHRLPGPPREGTLVVRANRFLARCRFPGGEEVDAHVPDRGRLTEVLAPGAQVLLYPAPEGGLRRTAWSLLCARDPGSGTLVAIDPAGAATRAGLLLARGLLPFLGGDWTVRPEVPLGRSRIDFLLERPGERVYVEVKSVGVVQDGVALFPDAPTERGARHLRELQACVRAQEARAMVLFVAQREDAQQVAVNAAVDPAFAATFREVHPEVGAAAIRFAVRPEGCYFRGVIPVAG